MPPNIRASLAHPQVIYATLRASFKSTFDGVSRTTRTGRSEGLPKASNLLMHICGSAINPPCSRWTAIAIGQAAAHRAPHVATVAQEPPATQLELQWWRLSPAKRRGCNSAEGDRES